MDRGIAEGVPTVSDAAEFVDAALQRESSWERAEEGRARIGGDVRFYGASVGAVRAAIRDVGRRHRRLGHDDIIGLASELWSVPVFERRLAAVVLLQSNVRLLLNSDLTRIEGFVRSALVRELVDPLAVDVVGPLLEHLDAPARARADAVLDRWSREDDAWLRRAAVLSPLHALRAARGDWDAFTLRARTALHAGRRDATDPDAIVQDAVDLVLARVSKTQAGLGVGGVRRC